VASDKSDSITYQIPNNGALSKTLFFYLCRKAICTLRICKRKRRLRQQKSNISPIFRDFQIKKYPNSFLWNGLLARPYLEQAGSLLHKIGVFLGSPLYVNGMWKIIIDNNFCSIIKLKKYKLRRLENLMIKRLYVVTKIYIDDLQAH
jgi:hypothetical protein